MRLRFASLVVVLLTAPSAFAQYDPPQPPPPPSGYYPPGPPQQPPPGYYQQQPPPGYYQQQPPPGYYPQQPPPPGYYPPRVYVPQPVPRRIVGFGTSLGFGSIGFNGTDARYDCSGGGCDTFVIGDLSVYLPLSPRFELQAWLPLLPMALEKNGGYNDAFFAPVFWGDVFFKIYTHGNSQGFFIAPGLGGWYWKDPNDSSYTISSFQIPFRIGWDIASAGRGFALSLAARPWLDIISDSLGNSTAGVGALFEVQVNFYLTK